MRPAWQPDRHLSNPLRAVLTAFTCHQCGRFDTTGAGPQGQPERPHFCRVCREEKVAGRLAKRVGRLGGNVSAAPSELQQELQGGPTEPGTDLKRCKASGTQYDRVLLHTADLPEEALMLLGQLWQLKEVPYIKSAGDLHVASDKARFKEVFTKLHVFNPEAVPYDKVVFLDLDMIVLRNIDELFHLRPPAGMSTFKSDKVVGISPEHGERLDPRMCYVNAGTMVTAPSKELFQLLEADVSEPDPHWHVQAWSPEQKYLSNVMAGEWSQVSQLYNFEVQLHSGVPLSELWRTAELGSVAVCHFSGHVKSWDKEPDEEQRRPTSRDDLSVLGSSHSRSTFDKLPSDVQQRAQARCSILHAEWHRMFSLALKRCRGALDLPGQVKDSGWTSILLTGSEHGDPSELEFMPGEEEAAEEGAAAMSCLATVLHCYPGGPAFGWQMMVRQVPWHGLERATSWVWSMLVAATIDGFNLQIMPPGSQWDCCGSFRPRWSCNACIAY
eukprot:g14924.t1